MFKRKEPAAEPVVSQPTGRVSQPAAASHLLRDIFSEPAASDPGAPSRREKPDALPLSQRLRIGAKLADARKRTIETAASLIALSDPETAGVIELLVEDLEQRACCIAFAGQFNAGKSTLINVLVEKPDLLPADVNPWTTVITRVHFGVPGKPESGASFTLFNRDEWRQLSTGGRTRLLTESLFPDFDWETLQSQVEKMQERAGRKLGGRFEDLLGTEHTYPEITPGLLNRYVGAGHYDADGRAAGTEGEYADITKLANIFLDLGAFSFPTILVDTPGVNDPFLVRDEITRQNLEAADICVIVLTARQPLSAADLDLLRTMRGLKKDRIVIFINKIDEISGGVEVLQEVSHRVSLILRQEFPSAHIPIVFGSALWARKALSDRRQIPDGKAAGSREGAAALDWPSYAEIADAVTEETYFLNSGLPSLAIAISELVSTGPIAGAMGATSSILDAICRNLISWLEAEAGVLSRIPAGLNSAKGQLSSLVELRAALAVEFNAFSQTLDVIRTQKVSELYQDMAQTLQASLTDTFAALPDDALYAQAGQIDAKLRVSLEGCFLAALEDADRRISGEQERLREKLTSLIAESGLKVKPAIDLEQTLAVSPSLAALSEPAAFGLTTKLREFAGTPSPTKPQSAYLLNAMFRGFESIMEKLAAEADRVMDKRSDRLIYHVKALTLGPLDIAINGISTAIQHFESPSPDDPNGQQLVERRVQALQEKVSALKSILVTGQTSVSA